MANTRQNAEGSNVGDPEGDFEGTYPGSEPSEPSRPTAAPKQLTNSQQAYRASNKAEQMDRSVIPSRIITNSPEEKEAILRSVEAAKAALTESISSVDNQATPANQPAPEQTTNVEQPPLPFSDSQQQQ